jgi:hypothetical protein
MKTPRIRLEWAANSLPVRSIYQFAGGLSRRRKPFGPSLPKGNRIATVVEQTGLAARLNALATRQANRLPTPAPTSVTTAHQPKTTAMHVPRLTRVTHE